MRKLVKLFACFAVMILLGVGIHHFGKPWVALYQFTHFYTPAVGGVVSPGMVIGLSADRCSSGKSGAVKLEIESRAVKLCSEGIWVEADTCIVKLGVPCKDGSYFVGTSPSDNLPMFSTLCDANHYWDGSACVRCDIAGFTVRQQNEVCKLVADEDRQYWNNGKSIWTITGSSSTTDGRKNTNILVNAHDTGAPYAAAKYCHGLSLFGHSDWYLPARDELSIVDAVRNIIFKEKGIPSAKSISYIWSSTEVSSEGAWFHHGGTSGQDTSGKNRLFSVLCVRK